MTIAEFIRQRRTVLGLSLREAARTIKTSPAYLSRIETGKAPASNAVLRRVARALETSEDELLLLAGRLPPALKKAAEDKPYEFARTLSRMTQMRVSETAAAYSVPLVVPDARRAIENSFPFDKISDIAEMESWRKEVYRPIYYLHKWWARRLGSVFRAAIIGAAVPHWASVADLFYEPVQFPGLVVFDPFMGSGTTIGEAVKLGCTAVGCDINPVAYRAVRAALGPMNRAAIEHWFSVLEKRVGNRIRAWYRSKDRQGRPCDVLYYFWVKCLPCPECGKSTDLFSSFVFAHHADASRHPTVRIICPQCESILDSTDDRERVKCTYCGLQFDPRHGWAKRTTAICKYCGTEFPIARTILGTGRAPEHRMYAKLVLRPDGGKEYLGITDDDRALFERASAQLRSSDRGIPRVEIADGHNTRQILNYGYRSWSDCHNDRQLLALALLAEAIREIEDPTCRDAFAMLFSGVLEFNNMFASYKGEGTGAVRHMFAHHILKPERMPIEANVWGTPASSGSFSTLYRSRLLRAIDYRDAPFEVAIVHDGNRRTGKKVMGVSPPIRNRVCEIREGMTLSPGSVYLACGDSAQIKLRDGSVDLVVTDPPFFDNVHYSELADFFYVWQQQYFDDAPGSGTWTTRRKEEVQDACADSFSAKLERVFAECCRVLRDDGLLVFSYQHSREDGWSALASAVAGAGFSFVQSQPVKAEMSVAAPKSQANEPTDLDMLMVCRKRGHDRRPMVSVSGALAEGVRQALVCVVKFNLGGRRLSRPDVRATLLSRLLVGLSAGRTAAELRGALDDAATEARSAANDIWANQSPVVRPSPWSRTQQLSFASV
jgi:putative DNA methylase